MNIDKVIKEIPPLGVEMENSKNSPLLPKEKYKNIIGDGESTFKMLCILKLG
jgi:hypothetical protein